ncbi:MAG TPA: DUF1254 domain-containing protein [Thermoleophilaceae bacterium]
MSSIDQATADAIAVEAYIYFYPLVLMDLTRRQMTNVATPGERPGRGPVDEFAHIRAFPGADFKDVVKPNFDTLYSPAWLDLHDEPRIVTVPAAGDNYYLLPMYDMWSEIFACPGTRTTGGVAASYALCGPGWDDPLPDGVERIDAPTPWVWMIGRTQASPELFDRVHSFQDGMSIAPLSSWPGSAPAMTHPHDPSVDDETPPLRQAFALDAAEYFAYAAQLLRQHAPHFNDHPILQRMARLGIVPGESFELDAAPSQVRTALEQAPPKARQLLTERQTSLGPVREGWTTLNENIGVWGTGYLRRACVDLIGLGANLPEDAIYPVSYTDVDGEPYSGERERVLHFAADGLPPVLAFWSLTLYDAEGFQVPNELDRFAIGDRDALEYNADGSLDIQIQHERPAGGSSNWLPAPRGGYNLCLRLYYPKPEALDGSWTPPGVAKA